MTIVQSVHFTTTSDRTVKTNMLNADIDDAHRDMILALCPEGMDIHYLVTTDESLQNALKKYTKWLDDQFQKRVGRKGEGGYLTFV